MNTFSVENRTRMNQPLERTQSRRNSFDDQFERELPPEIRAELGASPQSINRPPVRISETEAENEQALQWLKSQGYLRPTSPAPPPVPAPQPIAIPTATPRRGSAIWWLLAVDHWIASLARPALRQHATSSSACRGSAGVAGGRSAQSTPGGPARSARCL